MRALPLILGSILLGGCIAHHERVSYSHPGGVPVTTEEAIAMTQAGYADSSILKKIEDNGVSARPDADSIVQMKQAGVSDVVVNVMQEAPIRTYQPPVEHRTVYVRDYTPELIGGAAIVGGLILGHHYSHHYRSRHHYHGRSYYRRCR